MFVMIMVNIVSFGLVSYGSGVLISFVFMSRLFIMLNLVLNI